MTNETPQVVIHETAAGPAGGPAAPQAAQPPQPPQAPLPPTPTQAIARPKIGTETDELGRLITVKRLSAIERLNLFENAGLKLSQNQQWMGIIAIAASCVKINDEDIPKPMSPLEMKALVQRLDQEGLDAIQRVYVKVFGVKLDDEDDGSAATVKN